MYQTIYYAALFALSFLLTLLYASLWRRQFDGHMTVVFILIPITNLAYMLMYLDPDPTAVIALTKIVYISGCVLPWLVTMCVAGLCRIRVSRPLRLGSLFLSACVYLSTLTIGYLPLFYRSLSIEQVGAARVLVKTYGPVHTLHYVCVVLYLAASLAALLYTYRKKKQVSRRVLLLLFLPIPIATMGYFASRRTARLGYELMPLTYVLSQALYLLIAQRMVLYNVSDMVIESMVQAGETGFVTVDSKLRYLGSNGTARRFLPFLRSQTVDRPVTDDPEMRETVIAWIERFQKDPDDDKFLYTRVGENGGEDRIYSVDVNDLYDGRRRCGYQIFLQDDTEKQKYIRLLDRYNADLQAEVAAKTERIVVMHDRLILGMATMVESRDNSTGGHIRRTSEGVRILVETMRSDGAELSDSFFKNIIKAAPMHDLGKIAVDDAILRKAGRFTPEEFEQMKAHAAEGTRIVHEILRDTDDEDFRRIAENVAHYHHERMDGSGYPDGLKGDEIPLEARIMAVADVYDALVSKRVYKDAFSFEKADRIILEGMGPQFDLRLRDTYEHARPRLEAYYTQEREKA